MPVPPWTARKRGCLVAFGLFLGVLAAPPAATGQG
jgi:hypothetical protein